MEKTLFCIVRHMKIKYKKSTIFLFHGKASNESATWLVDWPRLYYPVVCLPDL